MDTIPIRDLLNVLIETGMRHAETALSAVSIDQVITQLRSGDADLRDVSDAHYDYDPSRIAKAMPGLAHDAGFRADFLTAKQRLLPLARMTRITVYRGYRMGPDLTRALGIHWSVAKDVAAYVGGPNLLTTRVTGEQINWVASVARAVYWWDDEQELSLLPGTRIVVTTMDGAQQAAVT